jgi:hypothetical protein
MAIAKITRQGLAVIATLVVLLWGCVIAEQVLVRRANQQSYQTLRDLQLLRMRSRPQPVSVPAPRVPHPERPSLG